MLSRMKFFTVTLALTFLAAAAIAETDDEKWEKYKDKFSQVYNPKEEAIRKTFFMRSQRAIEKQNKENHSWKADHNQFSVMSDDEKKIYLGYRDDAEKKLVSGYERSLEMHTDITNRQLLTELDLRTSSCMPPIKDQGKCGSCWAFAAVAAVEYASCVKTGSFVRLSEQQLVECDPNNGGCGGGSYRLSWANYIKNKGLMTDTSYPYNSGTTEVVGYCVYSPANVNAYTSGYSDIDSVNGNNTLIMQALSSRGILGTSLNVIDSFFSYSTGVYDDSTCPDTGSNHAVNLVGYGATSNDIPYWIVRNSWGTWWGQSGYFLIRRGVNRCNIEKRAAYVAIV